MYSGAETLSLLKQKSAVCFSSVLKRLKKPPHFYMLSPKWIW
ncbi:HTH-type transcriptional regulator GntR [Aggregatibacter aphrophilus NJ8700]|nr:HTH-type transcriptional regulator GntR [Aggregatibacter aphrophilus NJ8700]